MSFEYVQQIPRVEDILDQQPMSPALKRLKASRDAALSSVLTGQSDRFLVIIGPCSADREDAICDYVGRLAKLQERVQERLVLVPRIYTNKPRTTGTGYKGMAHRPVPGELPNIVEGLKALRQLHLRALAESHLTAADEMLYPENYPYVADFLSYVAIGARSVENQQHRLTVSGFDVPAGMKNPTSGDIEVMLNSIQAAQSGHVFAYNGWEVATHGNPLAHGILRGAVNHYGVAIPNYHYEDLVRTAEAYRKRQLVNPAVIVDTNHANSNKSFAEQPRIALEVMQSRRHSSLVRKLVRGLLIESYLVEGAQDERSEVYGKSITDPCLGWEASERLVLELAELA
ncbi:MAG: 3-deoxy-7-phosphoheptulonate synthase [Deltaproteobacteria bacterium]|nr:3-deoxy-7-phosphoheptulonate synthase [Deltaproteobacteria bacterium]